jgi:hypothetical protein
MLYSNEDFVKVLQTTIMITGLCTVLIMTVLIFLQYFIALAVLTGFFLLGLILISILNFQYLYIAEFKNKLIIRYYSVFAVNREYQSIEIPFAFIRKIKVQKLFFGLKWDLSFTVKIRQGIAEYPPVSLSAVPFKERQALIRKLKQYIPANSPEL